MKWTKTGRIVNANGESTIFYESDDGRFEIRSRKRAIPHANRSGYWMHTSYFLINSQTGKEKEFWTLKDAKEAVAKDGRV